MLEAWNKLRSWGGESSMSSSDSAGAMAAPTPAPNLKGGSCVSGSLTYWATVFVEKNLADLSKEGRAIAGLFRSRSDCSELCVCEESDVITGGELMVSSVVVSVSGVGTTSLDLVYGILCGRGEMSIASLPYPGEEDGIGGVVTPPHRTGGVVAPSGSSFSQ